MSRPTDERIDEILRPKELMGQTELESLASDVRELRESHSVACETCDGLRDSNHELRAENVRLGGEIRSLTTERLDLEERLFKANRQIEEFDVSGKRQDATINRLMTEKGRVEDELSSYKDALRIAQKDRDDWKSVAESMGESVNKRDEKVERLTHERDAAKACADRWADKEAHAVRAMVATEKELAEARELLRDLESRFPLIVQHVRNNPCTATEQPEPSGELVPWTAETRPRGVVFLRNHEYPGRERIAQTWNEGHVSAAGHGWVGFSDLFSQWEWSRDGITWQRCGVRT